VQLPQLPLPDLELSAIFGSGTAIHGTLSFSGKIRVEGEVEGHIKGGRLLIIGPGARVVGRIEADQVIVLGGVVEADIVATESIELYIPSQVSGELKSPQIYMDRGIRFQGTCDMTGSPPSVEPRPGHAF
jgi:cytoskeletal protein CcmA (bactofilin family)